MKRLNLLLVILLVSSPILMAGALKTNTNQSAAWVRTMSRNATLGIDAVYFNPAGLSHLGNGLSLSLTNQSIFQTRTVSSDYLFLTGAPVNYDADLSAPIYPSIYAAYKLNKWTFSAGFNIVGGGGSADFENGLPDFEIPIASLVPQLQGALAPIDAGLAGAGLPDPGYRAISGYNMNAFFSGTSAYMGYQVNATYAINDMISVAVGGRLVNASNSYEGALTDVTIDAPQAYGGTQAPGDYLRTVSTNPFLDAGTVGMLQATAGALDVATADAQLKATQSGTGFAPIIGVNFRLSEMLNLAIKYEFHTKIELTNDTEVDDVGMFPDGEKVRADMPGMLALGAELTPLKKLVLTGSFNYYLDKSAYYGVTDSEGNQIDNETTIDKNGITWAVSAEYKLIDILGVSAGYTSGNNGVNDNYQSGITYALKSASWGFGVFVNVTEKIQINAGYSITTYDDYSQPLSYDMAPTISVPYTDGYAKNTKIFGIGLDFMF